MTDWFAFYQPFFPSSEEARKFVDDCEAQSPPSNVAKLIMHQGQRLVSLAQEIPTIRPSRESLQVFFLIVCAEAIAKLDASGGAALGSRRAVRDFFSSCVPDPSRSRFGDGFTSHSHTPLGPQGAADILYDVRCDVAHKGNYWGFTLKHGGTPMLTSAPPVIAHLTIEELIQIVVHGCIAAARRHL